MFIYCSSIVLIRCWLTVIVWVDNWSWPAPVSNKVRELYTPLIIPIYKWSLPTPVSLRFLPQICKMYANEILNTNFDSSVTTSKNTKTRSGRGGWVDSWIIVHMYLDSIQSRVSGQDPMPPKALATRARPGYINCLLLCEKRTDHLQSPIKNHFNHGGLCRDIDVQTLAIFGRS